MKRMKRMLTSMLHSLTQFIPLESGDMLSPRRKTQMLKGKTGSRLDKQHSQKIAISDDVRHVHSHH